MYIALCGGNRKKKGPLGRHKRRGEDSVKIDFKLLGWEGRYWIDLDQKGTGEGLL